MKKMKKIGDKAYHYGFQLVAVGALTGLFAGLIVTLYNVLTSYAEDFSRDYYGFFRTNPAFIPLLFLALFCGAIVIGGVLRFIPMIRGSGIPQTEGATRGLLRFKWYQVLTGMFAASLFTVFMGLSAGSEGPSIQIGGACGYGTSDLLKRGEMLRRYQITGGACAGLAVAFNAPLTGMAFAFEEAHKRFTPEVFVCSFSSVITAIVTRNLLRTAMGLSVGSSFTTFQFTQLNMLSYLYVLFAAAICGLAGVGFYFLVFRAKKLFAKLTFWKGVGKMTIPFLLGGAFGLITVNVMGGGHDFIQSLGSLSDGVERIFSSPLWATLLIVLILKFIISIVNMGAGVPCGVFIPMLAVGACLGALLSLLCVKMGMDPAYSDAVIMICMAAFFTTVVKAPITAIVMVVELTWSFTFLTPVILGVAVGYLIGDVFRTEPIYDKLLEGILEEQRAKNPPKKLTAKLCVAKDSPADGRAVRDILWPSDALVVGLFRGD
ncbi:MAG: ClC family H(+)/Cl(-) exchange transporter, partial [Roseburia sp.]|nr:ClC family H(+)/Cl(-) exchange transporter [Roseburia sp.]